MFYKLFPAILYFIIFTLVIVVFGKPWGYDEFGVLITHIELTNNSFKNFYLSYFPIFENNNLLKEFFLFTLPIIISPLRWTYAIGISPIYSLMYFFPMDWELAHRFFLLIYVCIAAFGISLITKNLNSSQFEKNILLALLSIILISKNFNYWTLSLTHYSFNIICFGIFIAIYSNKKYSISSKVFSFKSIGFFIVSMLNYFYIPILLASAVIEILLHKSKFFIRGMYKSWILPGIGSFIGFCFIMIRTKFLDTNGLWSQNVYEKFQIYDHTFNGTLINFSERIVQIFYYFFLDNNYNQNFILDKNFDLNIFQASLVILFVIVLIVQGFKYSQNKKIAMVCMIIIFVTLVEYVFTSMPMIPSRHSLILFIPISYFFSVLFAKVISIFLDHKWTGKFLKITLSFALLIFFIHSKEQFEENKSFDIAKLEDCIENKVDQVILDQCYLKPVMYQSIREKYDPIYSCGQRVIQKLSNKTREIAFISNKDPYDNKSYIYAFLNEKDFLTKNNYKECKVENINLEFYKIENENK